jgi:hypothetical protein
LKSASAFIVRHGKMIALVLVAAALALRVPGTMTWWLNPDEGIYFSLVTQPTMDLFWAEVADNAHPPLYYLILRAVGFFTTDFLWFRALSLVTGSVAVFALWECGRRMVAGRPLRETLTGLAAAALLVASPPAIALSQVMRPYMLQLALVAGALALLLGYARAPSRRGLAAYVAVTVLALLTHYSSVLALGALGGVTLYVLRESTLPRNARRELALAYLIPLGVVAGMYLLHLKGLAASNTADEALEGWLSFYLVTSPREAWLAFVGLQTTVGGRGLGGPFTVLMLATFLTAAAGREWLPVVVAGSALAVGLVAAAAGVYPMGATRHSTWMLAFTLPAMAWTLGLVFSTGRRAVLGAAAAAVLFVGRQEVGGWLEVPASPWAPTERVLRRANLTGMLELLDPDGAPRLVVMDLQTYYLLIPFYYVERREARAAPELGISHFSYGRRELVVIQDWLLTGSGLRDLARGSDGAGTGPVLGPSGRTQVLVGGWRSEVVDELLAMEESGEVLSHRLVPGLFAFLVDMERLRTDEASPAVP